MWVSETKHGFDGHVNEIALISIHTACDWSALFVFCRTFIIHFHSFSNKLCFTRKILCADQSNRSNRLIAEFLIFHRKGTQFIPAYNETDLDILFSGTFIKMCCKNCTNNLSWHFRLFCCQSLEVLKITAHKFEHEMGMR